jgi:hypothetical protein
MLNKSKLGARFTCFQCGTKFYDLNRPTPTCPECQADQSDAPVQDFRRMLSSRKRKTEEPPAPEPKAETKDEDDDLGTVPPKDEGEDEDEDEDSGTEEGDSPEPLLKM